MALIQNSLNFAGYNYDSGGIKMNCTKIILSSYYNFNRMIKAFDYNVEERCLLSFHDNRDVETIFSEISDIMARKQKYVVLKNRVDAVFALLTDEETDLLRCKYFYKKARNKFDFSLRTYFRKQEKLLLKLDEYFSFIGINDEKFFKDFEKESFILCAKIKTDDTKRMACSFYRNCTENNLPDKKEKTVEEKIDKSKKSDSPIFERKVAV